MIARRAPSFHVRFAAGAALVLLSRTALPEPGLPELVVRRGADSADCPDAAALAKLVEHQTKRPALQPRLEGDATGPAPGADAVPRIEVEIHRAESGYAAVVRAADKTRQISDEGSTCAGLTEALAITLAIMLDREQPPPPPPPPPAPTIPSAPPAPPVAPPDAPKKERFLGLLVGGGFIASDGLLQPGAFGAELDVELRIGNMFSVETGAILLPAHGVALAPGTVDVDLMTGFVRGCAAIAGDNRGLHLRACADACAGAIWAEGSGYAVDRTSLRPWGAAGASVGARVPLIGPLALSLRGGFLVPFRRETFVIDNLGAAFEATPIAGVFDTGLRLTIW